MGKYESCDFVLLLLCYALSGEPSLKSFFTSLKPVKEVLSGLWGREALPSRSALSRFLQDVCLKDVEGLRALLFSELLENGLDRNMLGGLYDRTGARHLVFDVDMTKAAARQRALPAGKSRPAPRRRVRDSFVRGYSGRKRGEVVRSRCVVQQRHTQEWLGTWGAAGNGNIWDSLEACCQSIAAYINARGLRPDQALIRMDGAYGWNKGAMITREAGLGFLMRSSDYALLKRPEIRTLLGQVRPVHHAQRDTATQRWLFDLGEIDWRDVSGQEAPLRTRLIVAVSEAPAKGKKPKVGKRIGRLVFELFVTDRCADAFNTVELIELYFARGGFERRLWEEDEELEMDRCCSMRQWGEELWQVLCLHAWNMRLRMGACALQAEPRRIIWSQEAMHEAEPPDTRQITRRVRSTLKLKNSRIQETPVSTLVPAKGGWESDWKANSQSLYVQSEGRASLSNEQATTSERAAAGETACSDDLSGPSR